MAQNNVLKGVLLVGLGASSYGMLATFVKMAYQEGYTTAEVTASQFILGILGVLIINSFYKIKNPKTVIETSKKDVSQLLLAGTSLGFTSIFYYLSVVYINVSIAIVLLMQTVWMSVILEAILSKQFPSVKKIISTIIVLVGTVLATNILKSEVEIDWRGIMWGLLAAASFTTTMFASNRIATHLPAYRKSLFMLLGGAVIIAAFVAITYTGTFNAGIFLKWGIVLSLFGTVIPPLLLNAGFPHTGLGLGSIISSLELPVSVMMAYFLLNEQVLLVQWMGILLIILAIVIMNVKSKL